MRVILLYGMIGACIAGIPLALLLISQSRGNAELQKQILYYKKCEEQGMYLYVWTLNKDISAGKKAAKADFDQKKVWVSELDYMNLVMDIQQIAGKRAKADLNKGTVVQADLFYRKKKQKNAAE